MSEDASEHCGTCYASRAYHEPADGHAFASVFYTSGEDTVYCPWCGADNGTDDIDDGSRIDCSRCEREFSVEVQYDPRYSTSKTKCFACLTPTEHPLHVQLGSGEGACSEACQTACADVYAAYLAEYKAGGGRGARYPSRGFLVKAKEGAA